MQQRGWAAVVVALGMATGVGGCGSDVEPKRYAVTPSGSPDDAEPASVGAPDVSPQPVAPLLAPASGGAAGEEASDTDFVADEVAADDSTLPLSPEESCAIRAVEAETIERVVEVPIEEEVVVPSVFYLMLDSSGSMQNDPFTLTSLIQQVLDFLGLGGGAAQPNKWDYAVAGLKRFVNDPDSAGLELSLGYFPEGGQCDGSGYDVPSVPLGELPQNAPAIESSLDARVPAGGTPLEGALRGATRFCLAFNKEHPEASCVAVLITDGAAAECDARTAAQLAAIATGAAEQGVLTFAAGMEGADFAVLDAIGRAGGGDCDPSAPGFACDLTSNQDAFTNALNGIRDRTRTQTRIERRIEREVQTLPCEWEIPEPPAGEVFDSKRINVAFSTPLAAARTLTGVAQAADCGAAGGWYYDDPLQPSSIRACPSSCELLSTLPDARVDLLFGCRTIIR